MPQPSPKPPAKSPAQIKNETSAMAELLRITDPKRGLTNAQQKEEIRQMNLRRQTEAK